MEEKDRRRPPRGGYRGRQSRPPRREEEKNEKVDNLVRKAQEELASSIVPIAVPELNAFERKLVHRHFDHNPNIVTKTYRHGEEYELRIYPVGNLRKYALDKANEAIEKREKVVLPHMSNYERFVVHEALQTMDTVKSTSQGEGEDRHVEIEPEMFGRSLKRIIKKIKLF